MILPLGPQNAFVMNQGIRRQYHLMIALLCALSDLALISAGIFGGSALLMQSPWLLALVTWGGVAFLLWYGFGALKTAMSSNLELASAEVMNQGALENYCHHAGGNVVESARLSGYVCRAGQSRRATGCGAKALVRPRYD
ncbi:membrane transport protein [Salmonella enterica subsp. arizonae]|uniref:Membrane transport protein n=1 Tax=Salmonella enterica subsp. arizonae TaxID=59203 RepID=A0A379TL08_SALER|nr:membrane transport protein [Salmonella enterica subsp. arizonae]